MAACVADVSDLEAHLDPHTITRALRSVLCGCSETTPATAPAALLVVEANLSEASLLAACRLASDQGIAVILEPVSPPKSVRTVASLRHVAWVTPNANELRAMAAEVCRRHSLCLDALCSSAVVVSASDATSPTAALPSALHSLAPHAAAVLCQGVCCIRGRPPPSCSFLQHLMWYAMIGLLETAIDPR